MNKTKLLIIFFGGVVSIAGCYSTGLLITDDGSNNPGDESDADADAVTDTDQNQDVDADTDTDGDADTGTDFDLDNNADAAGDTDSGINTDIGDDTDSESGSDVDVFTDVAYACPAALPDTDLTDGVRPSCSDETDDHINCLYGESVICVCGRAPAHADMMWQCGTCPSPAPADGDVCDVTSLRCDYDTAACVCVRNGTTRSWMCKNVIIDQSKPI